MFQGWRQVVKGFLVCVLAVLLVACVSGSGSLYDRLVNSVVRIDAPEAGSGVIFRREGDQYWVVTAAHVVDSKNPDGSYQTDVLVTPDPVGETRTITAQQKQFIPNTDLAVLTFTSEQDYAVAKIGDSAKLQRGEEIIVVGAPESTPERPQRGMLTSERQIIDLTVQTLGYGLSYEAITQQGMSGGGVFDQRGRLVGIHGRSFDKDGSKFAEGMPIQLLGSLAQVKTEIALPKMPWRVIAWIVGGIVGMSLRLRQK